MGLKKQTSCKYTDQQRNGAHTGSRASCRGNNGEHRVRLQLHQAIGHHVHQPKKQPLLQQQHQMDRQAHNNQQCNHRQYHHCQHNYQEKQRAAATVQHKPLKSPNEQIDQHRVNTPLEDFGFDVTVFPTVNAAKFVTAEDMNYPQWTSWGDEESEV